MPLITSKITKFFQCIGKQLRNLYIYEKRQINFEAALFTMNYLHCDLVIQQYNKSLPSLCKSKQNMSCVSCCTRPLHDSEQSYCDVQFLIFRCIQSHLSIIDFIYQIFYNISWHIVTSLHHLNISIVCRYFFSGTFCNIYILLMTKCFNWSGESI